MFILTTCSLSLVLFVMLICRSNDIWGVGARVGNSQCKGATRREVTLGGSTTAARSLLSGSTRESKGENATGSLGLVLHWSWCHDSIVRSIDADTCEPPWTWYQHGGKDGRRAGWDETRQSTTIVCATPDSVTTMTCYSSLFSSFQFSLVYSVSVEHWY